MSNSTVSELESLAGLESAKRVVLGLVAGSAVHAVLFYGIAGSGKERLAQILAKSLLCKSPTPDGACGICQACNAFERGKCADYLDIFPMGQSRIIRIGAMIDTEPYDEDYPVKVQPFLRTPPLSARGKVVVLHEAERLNARAANSLLKTLEEPPPYAHFILITETVGSILPTILSRCVAVACEVPPNLEGFEQWALELADGAPGRAREFEVLSHIYRPLYDFAMALPNRPKAEAMVAAEQFGNLADALEGARKLNARAANAESLQVLASAYALSPAKRADALQAMVEAHRRILGNANAGSVFDALFAVALG